MTAPVLVLGWGNLSRGDDALGPMLVQALAAMPWPEGAVDLWDDHQLQVEHALDLVGRRQVLLIDASTVCQAPFEASTVHPSRDASLASHALTPQALLQVYVDLHQAPPPPCTLLALQAQSFELGESPGRAALANLAAALPWARAWLAQALAHAAQDGA